MRVLACELHANRSAVFGPDQMTGLNFQRIQETCDVGGEFAGAPAISGRLGRGAKARQVETNDTVLVRQMRHPRDQAREDSELPCTITTVSGTLHGWPNQSSS